MVLRGNFLYNGDFETGDLTNWELGRFGLVSDIPASITTEDKYKGNYAVKFLSSTSYVGSHLISTQDISFEEYEAFLFKCMIKNVDLGWMYPTVYFEDDNGELLSYAYFGYIIGGGGWEECAVLLRRHGLADKFAVGIFAYSTDAGQYGYADWIKVMPIKSLKSCKINTVKSYTSKTSSFNDVLHIGCVGEFKLYSKLAVEGVSGSSPTLDVQVSGIDIDTSTEFTLIEHTQATDTMYEIKSVESVDIRYMLLRYTIGGTDPSFNFKHIISLMPK